jgi:SDR family mycofactocin-dependent oxidoreductase
VLRRVEGKVALITGAARGQGRSHAVRLAEEGADIIAIDICDHIETAAHSMATQADLDETVDAVERLDRRIVARKADVRDRSALEQAVSEGIAELGRLDIVSVNAAITSVGRTIEFTQAEWGDVIAVNLTGAWNTAAATIPHILSHGEGGSVIFTSSAAGLKAVENIGHYNASKHGVIGLMKTLALELGPSNVRVNAICPTNVDTPMLVNDKLMRLFMPHLDAPTRADAEAEDSNYRAVNAIPIPWVEPVDISNALVFLASQEARYITGVALPVDAGFLLK